MTQVLRTGASGGRGPVTPVRGRSQAESRERTVQQTSLQFVYRSAMSSGDSSTRWRIRLLTSDAVRKAVAVTNKTN